MNQLETWGHNRMQHYTTVWRSPFWTAWMEACMTGLTLSIMLLLLGALTESQIVLWGGVLIAGAFGAGVYVWTLRTWPGLLLSMIGYVPETVRFIKRDIGRYSSPLPKALNALLWLFLFPCAVVFTWWEEFAPALVAVEPC